MSITEAWAAWREAQKRGDEIEKHRAWSAFLLLVLQSMRMKS